MAPAGRATSPTRTPARTNAAAAAAANTPPANEQLVLPASSFWALALAPLLLWWGAVLTGAAHHPGGFDCGHECALRLGKPQGGHALEWWDRGVVRPAGPLLPFAVLALRAAALWASSLLSPPSPPSSSSSSRSSSPAAVAALGTLTLECAALYAGVAAGRVLAYLAHAGALRSGWLRGHVVSDHLFLAASMLACLQAEAACAASDLRRAAAARRRARGHRAREGALGLVLLAAAALYALTAADMYFTARYYHVPRETLATAGAVFLVFQAPVLAWLSARRARLPPGGGAAAAAAAAGLVGAAAVSVGAQWRRGRA